MKNARIEAIISKNAYANNLGYDEDQENYAFDMADPSTGEVVGCRVAPLNAEGLEAALVAFGDYACLTLHKGDGYSSLGFALDAFFG